MFCMFLSQQAFSMEIVLDNRERIQLNDPLPSIINTDNRQQPPQYWLKQTYDTKAFLPSIEPGPLSSWHKIQLTAHTNSPYIQERVLAIETHILRHLNLYLFDGNLLVKQVKLGLLEREQNPNDHFSGLNFHFYIQHNQNLTLLIEKQNDGPAIIPMTIYSEDGFNELVRFQDSFWASIVSVLIAMAIYNVLVYAMHPSASYLWYLAFHSVAFFYFAALNGYGNLFLPHTLQVWLAQNIMFLNFVLLFFVINFANEFLQSKHNAPWHAKYIVHFRVVTVIGGIISLFITEYNMIPVFIVFQFLASIYGISMGVVALKNNFRPALYFLFSWIFTLTGGAVGMATVINILPINFVTLHGFLFGTLLELFLLSIALASRMKHMENSLLTQLYYYPDTRIANFSYLKNKLPEYMPAIKQKYSNPVFIIADMQGFREIVGLYGPNVLTKLYRQHTDRFSHYLSTQAWAIPLPMPIGKQVHIMALPAEQILCLVDLPVIESNEALARIIDDITLQSTELFHNKQLTSRMQMTLGCAIIREHDVQEAFRQAQVALLSSIKAHKKWLLYDSKQDHSISQRIELVDNLQVAINQDDLSIYIQPQINLLDDSINGGEILLRWNHAEKGSISPARFIPLAEQSGLVFQITQQVFVKTCRWLNELDSKGLLKNDFRVSINLSALDMAESGLISFLEDNLKRFQLTPKFFTLEITESAVMDNPQLFIASIKTMKSMGFKISIDDFGTGYSSMMYLQNIEPSEIKIDMAFIRGIHLNAKNQNIVKAIVQLAHSNQATIVAEGVECEHELSFISGLDCDLAQGYHWCPAIPLDEFEKQYLKYEQ